MSEQRGLRTGHLLALAGAGVTLASLWAPWYRLHLPAALRDLVQQRADAFGPAAGNFVRALTALLPASISGDAWTVFAHTDIVLAMGSALVGAVLLAAAGAFGPGIRVAGGAAARIAAGAGAIGFLVVAARIADPPGPNAYLDVRWGAWAGLIGCALMVAGGLMVSREDTVSVTLDPAPAVTGSVAPPA
jgi:hypothetical protein